MSMQVNNCIGLKNLCHFLAFLFATFFICCYGEPPFSGIEVKPVAAKQGNEEWTEPTSQSPYVIFCMP